MWLMIVAYFRHLGGFGSDQKPKSYRRLMHSSTKQSCEAILLDPEVAKPLILYLHSFFANLVHAKVDRHVLEPCVTPQGGLRMCNVRFQIATSPWHLSRELLYALRGVDTCALSKVSWVGRGCGGFFHVAGVIRSVVC